MKVDYKYIDNSIDALLKLHKAAKAKWGDEVQTVRVKCFDSTKAKGVITLKNGKTHQITARA